MSDGWKSARYAEGGKVLRMRKAIATPPDTQPTEELTDDEMLQRLTAQIQAIDLQVTDPRRRGPGGRSLPLNDWRVFRHNLLAIRSEALVKKRAVETRIRDFNRTHLSVDRKEFDKALSLLMSLRAIASGFDLTAEENSVLIEAGALLSRNRRIP